MSPSTSAALLVALLAAVPARAEERFAVLPAGAGPQRLPVPPAFRSASARGDLADLRLADAAGREVPYLLVPPPDPAPRWVGATRVRPIPRTKTESGVELDLGAVREVAGVRLPFEGLFLKRVRLEGSADGVRWTTLSGDDVLFALEPDPGERCVGCGTGPLLVRRELRFLPAAVRFVRAVLDDRRSPRLAPPDRAEALLAAGAPPAGARVPLEVIRRESEPGTSRFGLRLPGLHLPVRAIALELAAPRLARRARVLEARLAGGRLAPVELGAATLLRTERDGVTVSDLSVPVSTPEELELELAVDDGDNGPLALGAAFAELAPEPSLFFESADGAPLDARLGDASLRAPAYDLEALRPELPRLRTATARLGPAAAAPLAPRPPAIAAAEVDAALPGAPLDPAAFRHARAIPAAAPGLAAVALDAAVLARSPGLGDLRIAAPDGRQVPYLLEERDGPLPVPLAAERALPADAAAARASPGETVHALALPEASFPAARLVLETSGRVFARRVTVLALDDDPSARGPRLLASAAWSHADPGRTALALTIPLPAFRARRLLVALDDGDNAPLPLVAARLLLPSWRLRFFHPGPPLRLLHGSDAVGPGRYDLELLAPRLRAAPARELALGAAPGTDEPGRSGAVGRGVFWAVLGLAVAGLLALVARLLRHAAPPSGGAAEG